MTIKLIRTDAIDCAKIQLNRGEHIIGRGKLLDCNDKRISREHGELVVNDDSITVKALHQNPCFYTKKGTNETEILKQGNSITLKSGDRFGLLPETYWYEVVHCLELVESEDSETQKCTEEYPLEEAKDQNVTNDDKTSNGDDSRVVDFNYDETLNKDDGPESPSIINNQYDETDRQQQNEPLTEDVSNEPASSNVVNEPASSSVVNEPASSNVVNEPDSTNVTENEPKCKYTNESSTSPSVKRSHSPDVGNDDISDVKKIKTEDVKVKVDPDAAKPGPSDQAASANVNNALPSNNKPNRPRERCIYGANCYRRNPQHKDQFSHPSDPDWGPGVRGVCPYGLTCSKRDLRHWRAHDHPPGALPPPGPGRKIKKNRRYDGLPDQNIVTGKRVRRAVQNQNWNDSGSDQESDPYGTDESDEWKPDRNDYSEDYV
ncbi:aprataxin and PNK-like factor [Melitaea cinxia]|uniref:aprataxin and PNK-like factor n=1 Tax=Melitaea cinxia TaxID=113334 RepID=UPI001E273ACC|nr:aprataxin and PNK-like factor [Melitaea cinxia]